MRTLLSAWIIAIASFAHAQTVTDYRPSRDTYMRGAEDPLQAQQLHGTSTNGRASKAFGDFYITDFDRAAINGSIAGQLGHPLTMSDMANIEISLNLFSNDFQGYQPTALSRPAVFLGTRDWVEGTNTTVGATKNYAFYDPVTPANNLPWRNLAGTDVRWFFNLDKVENANFEEWGGQAFTYRRWVLDDNVAFTYLTNPSALGLFLNASDAPNPGGELAQYSNTEVFSRDTTNNSRLPFLQVVVVPEPAVPGMLGLGALLLAGRRRRRL